MSDIERINQIRDDAEERRRCRSVAPVIPPDALISNPYELIPRDVTPNSIAEWKAVADGFLTDESCAFHRNVEISARYTWLYKLMPTCFKWAGMAAIASHHVRLALFPLRLDTDRTGYVNIPHSLVRRRMLMDDVHVIRATNNAIFGDIFWAHLVYASADDGIERLRALIRPEPHYAPVLSGFESIDLGRRVLEDRAASAQARLKACDLIWNGNVQLLEHEQRALVQPNFDRLSCAFARLISIGSATRFEVHGMRHEAALFTSFYLASLTRGVGHARGGYTWPRISRFDDRWCWLIASVVPRFRMFDDDMRLIDPSLRRILAQARAFATMPCVLPLPLQVARSGRRA